MRAKRIIGLMLALGVLAGVASARGAESPDPQQAAIGRMPPRLSFADGQVSFWRPGAQDWAQAQVNTPLAPGDELYTGSSGNLELQIGARAFVRGWANSQIGLENQEPDFLQFKVTSGHASFDIRTLEPGRTVEVDTPNAAFTIEHAGYYRVDVIGQRTSFIARRGGRATVTPASGEAFAISPSEEAIIEGTASPQVTSFVAPPLDDWDTWNYARTDALLDAVSARYVSPGVYGVDDLDSNGTWRVVPTYGPVWVPTAVGPGWAPYSTGSWTLDPYYGWSWVDTAPWGWGPYHHGRWIHLDGYWAWAPGPLVVRPAYAPALVGFFGGPGVHVGVGIGGPVVGWVALGWGEPLVPWWGRPGFVHVPTWRGWGGPRVVNNLVIDRTTVVNVQTINFYRNAGVQHAVVAVGEGHFGRGPIASARLAQVDVKNLRLIHTGPQVAATPASFAPTAGRGIRPPEGSLSRSVVATRPPHSWSGSASGGERSVGPAGIPKPEPRLVKAPQQGETVPVLPRPRFGKSTAERPTADRAQPPSPPGREIPPGTMRGPAGTPPSARQAPPQRTEPQVAGPSPATPKPKARRVEAVRPPTLPLPGEPANRLSPDRAETKPPPHVTRKAPPPQGRPKGTPEKAAKDRPGGKP